MTGDLPSDPPRSGDQAPLNPALKQVHDATYGPQHSGTDPMSTVSIQKEEGAAWPMIWAVVTIACVLIAAALIFL